MENSTQVNISLVAMLNTPEFISDMVMQPSSNSSGLMSVALQSNAVRSWMAAANIPNGPEWFNLDCAGAIQAAFGKEFSVRGSSISPDGYSWAAASYRGHICVLHRNGNAWDVSAVLDFPQKNNTDDPGRKASRTVVFSPSGNRIVAGDDAAGVHGWERAASGSWEAIGDRFFDDKLVDVRVVAWSWDEKWVLCGGRRGSGVWNIYDEKSELQEFNSTVNVYSGESPEQQLQIQVCPLMLSSSRALVFPDLFAFLCCSGVAQRAGRGWLLRSCNRGISIFYCAADPEALPCYRLRWDSDSVAIGGDSSICGAT